MWNRAKLYHASVGINNKVTPHRLKYDPETGICALEQAENVIINSTGEVVTRKGYSLSWDNPCHSVFSCGNWGLVAGDRVSDTAVYKVTVNNGAIVTTGIQAGFVKGRHIEFCDVAGLTFYANGFNKGLFDKSGNHQEWTESNWPSDETHGQFTSPPNNIEKLAYNAGRIFFATEDNGHYLINYTEYGLLGTYDLVSDGEQLPSRIIFMDAVSDGLYVSDEKHIYFLQGLDPHKWTCKIVTSYPAKEWGKHHGWVDPSDFGIENNRPSRLVATVNGPVLLMPGGSIINLIDKGVTMPVNCSGPGAIGVFDKTLVIQSGGESAIAVQGAVGGIGNKATAQFTNYGFQSFAVIDGVPLGANSTGLFRLNTGEQDNGQEYSRSFTPATTDFGISNFKKARKAFLGFSADEEFTLTTTTDDQVSKTRTVDLKKTGLQRRVVALGRKQSGRYWKVKVSSTSAFRFDSIDLLMNIRSAGFAGY